MKKLAPFIQALRPHTLPLSVSGIILGSFLAYRQGSFSWPVFGLALFTTLGLQIISNLANDLGDMQKGADNSNRIGPVRGLQSGKLTVSDYRRWIAGFGIVTITSGLLMIYRAFDGFLNRYAIGLIAAGALAVFAALTYTWGKKAYGYRGMGDAAVFLFFGWVATCGSYFLMRPVVSDLPFLLLPASCLGFFITGVLNINNMRDIENDAASGKKTMVVKLGLPKAKIYHFTLLIGGWLCMLIYTVFTFTSYRDFLYVVTLPLFVVHLQKIRKKKNRELAPYLKSLSLAILAFCLSAAAGAVWGR